MLSKLLFGVHNSPQRKICVVIAIVLTILGLVMIVVQGQENGWQGALMGVAFTFLGLLAIAVMSRGFAAMDEKAATQQQLGSLTNSYNVTTVQAVAEGTPMAGSEKVGRVTGQIDATEIRETIDHVREKSEGA